MSCCACASTLIVAPVPTPLPGPGEPGGTLPAGTEAGQFLQWNGVLWVPSAWILPEASPGAGDVGKVLTVSAAGVTTFEESVSKALATFSAIGILNGTSFLFPFGTDSSNTIGAATAFSFPVPFDCTIGRIHALHNVPTGGTDILYTVQINGVDTAVMVTLNSGATSGANLIDEVAVLSGDRVRLSATQASGATVVGLRPTISIQLLS